MNIISVKENEKYKKEIINDILEKYKKFYNKSNFEKYFLIMKIIKKTKG